MDEIDIEMTDEQDVHQGMLPIKEDDDEQKEDKKGNGDEKVEGLEETMDKTGETDTKDKGNQDPSDTWDKLKGGIATFGRTLGSTVIGGLAKFKQAAIGGGADAPGGEL
jgi:hypothetical protein